MMIKLNKNDIMDYVQTILENDLPEIELNQSDVGEGLLWAIHYLSKECLLKLNENKKFKNNWAKEVAEVETAALRFSEKIKKLTDEENVYWRERRVSTN